MCKRELSSLLKPVCVLVALLLPAMANAQTQAAELTGLITDATGSVVPGATITLTNVDTGVSRSLESNDSGNYVFGNLTPGRYRVTVAKQGFRQATSNEITLDVNQSASLPVALQLGALAETVQVSAESAALETNKGQMGTVVTEEKIADLPLNARNFTQLLTLTPGSTPVSVGQNSGGAQVQKIGVIVFPAVNGQRNRSNSFTLDGVYNNGHFMGTYAIAPSVDALSQFKVQSQGDQAEFGGVSGGVVNIVSKSGSNGFHGSVYEFLRNDALDARNFFAASRQPLRQNQFGATLGGPVIKDRTFFFFSYEGYRQKNAADSLSVVPTLAERQGDFRNSARTIYNPYTTRPDPASGGLIRDPFPNSVIPSSLLNPSMVEWVKAVLPPPVETGVPGFNIRNTAPREAPANQYNVRVDHNFSQSNLLWGRYTWGNQDQIAPMQLPGTTVTTSIPAKNLGVSYTHVFGSNGLFNALFGYSSLGLTDARKITDQNLLERGLFKGFAFSDAVTAPGMQVPSAFGQLSVANRVLGPMVGYQWQANYARVTGAHSWKTGVEMIDQPWRNKQLYPLIRYNALQTADPRNTGRTGNDIASFMLGVPDSWQVINQEYKLHSRLWDAYIQDSWKVNAKLTLNFGLRWDGVAAPVVTKGFPGNWDFSTGKYYVGAAAPPTCSATQQAPCLVNPGDPYLRDHVVFTGNSALRKGEWRLFGPRFGLAYRATPSTVVRGSFGILYDLLNNSTQESQNTALQWPSRGLSSRSTLNRNGVELVASDPLQGANANIPDPTPASADSVFFDSTIRSPYSSQWSLEIQQKFRGSTILSAAYVGNHSVRLPVTTVYNTAFTPGPGDISPRAPFPYAPVTTWFRGIGQSSYNGLQLKLERRLAGGGSYLLGYTWSKTIDLACSGIMDVEGCALQNPFDLNGSRSVAGFDIPHVFSLASVYELPFGRGRRWATQGPTSAILGNWQLNGVLVIRSGQPYTPMMGVDVANIGDATTRPNLVQDPHLSNRSPQAWFNTAAFASPNTYSFGNAGRNILRSDGYSNLDLSVFRQGRITERVKLQLRVEAFNILNHATFGIPDATLADGPRFGTVTSTISSARQVQLGLKLLF